MTTLSLVAAFACGMNATVAVWVYVDGLKRCWWAFAVASLLAGAGAMLLAGRG